MSDLVTIRFRRKWRCKTSRRAPFPVPIASRMGHSVSPSEWPTFKGRLLGKTVLVENSEDILALQQGFFGGTGRRIKRRIRNDDKGAPSCQKTISATDTMQTVDNCPLRLSFEEAFFLSFAFGCLHVTDNDKIMNLEELLSCFMKLDSKFLQRYNVYHYYRSLGWVVKPGIKFGVDYILYKEGPPFYHASYSVMIQLDDENNHINENLTWPSLAGLNRLCERVAKELVICYISEIKKLNCETNSLSFIDQIFRFDIKNVQVRRWISSEERKCEDDT
ncbi:tRNA-splicing endonuclease subunit Sen2 [Chamberlinius hualienensis]